MYPTLRNYRSQMADVVHPFYRALVQAHSQDMSIRLSEMSENGVLFKNCVLRIEVDSLSPLELHVHQPAYPLPRYPSVITEHDTNTIMIVGKMRRLGRTENYTLRCEADAKWFRFVLQVDSRNIHYRGSREMSKLLVLRYKYTRMSEITDSPAGKAVEVESGDTILWKNQWAVFLRWSDEDVVCEVNDEEYTIDSNWCWLVHQ